MPSNHLILCCPLLLLPSIFLSIRVFSNESVLCSRWPKYWSFSFRISPSNECSSLISFGIDWFDLFAVQGTLKSLLQHCSSEVSILWLSAFFTVQLSDPYVTTGETIALTRQTFFGKVMSLLFNMLSRCVIFFLPRSKYLLISWLQSPSAVILESPKIKSITVYFHWFIICFPWSDGTRCHDLSFWMLSFKPTFSLSSFTFIKRLFSSPLLSAIGVVSSAYLRLLIFLPAVWIPACASSSLAFCMMYLEYIFLYRQKLINIFDIERANMEDNTWGYYFLIYWSETYILKYINDNYTTPCILMEWTHPCDELSDHKREDCQHSSPITCSYPVISV